MTIKVKWPEFLKVLICATGLMATLLAFADEGKNLDQLDHQFNLTSVQVGAMGVAQGSGLSETAVLNYRPSYQLNSRFSIGAELGFTYLKLDDSTRFSAFGYLADIDYRLNSNFLISVRVGAQTWTCTNCGTKFAMGPEFAYEFTNALAGLIENIWFSYLPVFQTKVAHEFSVGVGFNFGRTK